MRTLATIVAGLILCVCLKDQANAQVPRIISYQGVLTDSTGMPKTDGNYTFVFRFYKSATGGAAIWEESKSLPTTNGLFSTMLGDQSAFPDSVLFTEPYWLGLEVEGTTLVPRIRLGAVGYAIRAINADTAQFVLNAGSVQRPISPGVSEAEIQDGAVTSQKIADGSITTADVSSSFKAPRADTAEVALAALSSAPTGLAGGSLSGSYPNPSIAGDAVTTAEIADGTITGDDIAYATITSVNLANGVTVSRSDTAAIAENVLTSANITVASISGDGSGLTGIEAATIADSSVSTGKILFNAVTDAKIASLNASKLFGSLPALDGSALTGISATSIADSSVSTDKILFGAVTDPKIVSLDASKLFGNLPALDGSALTNVDAALFDGFSSSDFSLTSHSHTLDNLSGTLSLGKGGTGSATRNFIYLNEDDTVRGTKVFAPTSDVPGLIVKQGSSMSEPSQNIFVVQDVNGNNVMHVGPGGQLNGDGSGLLSLNASELGFGTIPSARLSGVYGSALTFSNTLNSYSGQSLSIDGGTLHVDDSNDMVGVLSTSPVSSLEIQGSLGLRVRKLTSGDSPYPADHEAVLLADLSDGGLTINLPKASTVPGRIYFFKIVANPDYNLTILPYEGDVIDGSLTSLLLGALNRSTMIVCDGIGWHILGFFDSSLLGG